MTLFPCQCSSPTRITSKGTASHSLLWPANADCDANAIEGTQSNLELHALEEICTAQHCDDIDKSALRDGEHNPIDCDDGSTQQPLSM